MKITKKQLAGRIITAFVAIFMGLDGILHILKLPIAVDALVQLGYPANVSIWLGLAALISTILYVFPRTKIWGAILLTAYLGGAVATNVRVAAPLFSSILFPVYVGIFVWAGISLREERFHHLVKGR